MRSCSSPLVTYTNYWIICSLLHSATVSPCCCHCCQKTSMSTSNQSIPNFTDTRRNYFLLIDHNFQSSLCHRCRFSRKPSSTHRPQCGRDGERPRGTARVTESTYHSIMMGTSAFIFILFFRSTKFANFVLARTCRFKMCGTIQTNKRRIY